MMIQALRLFFFICAILLHYPGLATAQPLFAPTQDPLMGSRVFGEKGCSKCHAIFGVGGTSGPDLARLPRARSFYDLAAAMWNHLPKMTEQMRKAGIARPYLSPSETGDLIAFLYTVNYFEPAADPKEGHRVFMQKRCVTCHQVDRIGGVIGPSRDIAGRAGSPISYDSTKSNPKTATAEA